MALYTGVTGKLSFKASGAESETDIVHMSSWNVSLSKEILEVLSFGSDYKEKAASIKDWSASADGTCDFDTKSGQKILYDAFESGNTIKGTFYLNENTFLQGDCLVESLEIDHSADGKADISISLAGSKAAVLTLPTG